LVLAVSLSLSVQSNEGSKLNKNSDCFICRLRAFLSPHREKLLQYLTQKFVKQQLQRRRERTFCVQYTSFISFNIFLSKKRKRIYKNVISLRKKLELFGQYSCAFIVLGFLAQPNAPNFAMSTFPDKCCSTSTDLNFIFSFYFPSRSALIVTLILWGCS